MGPNVRLLWPHLSVRDMDASLAFYRDTLGFEQDLDIKDPAGKTTMASVEVGNTVIMLHCGDPGENPCTSLSLLFDKGFDLDAFYHELRAKNVTICREIGNRPWGHRDFGVRDPDGYLLTFCQ